MQDSYYYLLHVPYSTLRVCLKYGLPDPTAMSNDWAHWGPAGCSGAKHLAVCHSCRLQPLLYCNSMESGPYC